MDDEKVCGQAPGCYRIPALPASVTTPALLGDAPRKERVSSSLLFLTALCLCILAALSLRKAEWYSRSRGKTHPAKPAFFSRNQALPWDLLMCCMCFLMRQEKVFLEIPVGGQSMPRPSVTSEWQAQGDTWQQEDQVLVQGAGSLDGKVVKWMIADAHWSNWSQTTCCKDGSGPQEPGWWPNPGTRQWRAPAPTHTHVCTEPCPHSYTPSITPALHRVSLPVKNREMRGRRAWWFFVPTWWDHRTQRASQTHLDVAVKVFFRLDDWLDQ